MIDIIKIAGILILILLLLRHKWRVGYVLMAGAFLLSLLYLLPLEKIFETIHKSLISKTTFHLLAAFTCIRIFEKALRDQNMIFQMMKYIKQLIKNKRFVLASMPLLIGMLPSIGGAYFSAPLVDEAAKGLSLSSEEKTFTNYWYRHPWEFVLPLYPGLILLSAITKIEIRNFIFLHLSCAISMIVVGIFFGMKKIKGRFTATDNLSVKGLWSFLPLTFLLFLVIGLNIPLHFSLLAVITAIIFFCRIPCHRIIILACHGFSIEVITLIAGVMLFKGFLVSTGAMENLVYFFILKEIPVEALLFLLPFLSGLLTGISIGFVGISFPLLVNLPGMDIYSFSFAFVSGFLGVLLSPVHVCLILTKEYFEANMIKVYKKLIPATVIIFLVALIQYIVLSP